MKYKRILVKISGEWLANKATGLNIDYSSISKLTQQFATLIEQKAQIAIVVGGGNFWRGAQAEKEGIPRSRADYIGMLATLMNALALQSVLEVHGLKTRVVSALQIDQKVAEVFVLEKVNKYLNSGQIVIMAAGTGRPYFTTDTAATLVASEIKADVLLFGKNNVAGVYDADPNLDPQAKHYPQIHYDELLQKDLKVIDAAAAAMARDNDLTLLVFNIDAPNAIVNVFNEQGKFTKVFK